MDAKTKNTRIIFGSDHGGYDLKKEIIKYLTGKQYMINDIGTHLKESCHYPDYANIVAETVHQKQNIFGILVCTTG